MVSFDMVGPDILVGIVLRNFVVFWVKSLTDLISLSVKLMTFQANALKTASIM